MQKQVFQIEITTRDWRKFNSTWVIQKMLEALFTGTSNIDIKRIEVKEVGR